MKKLLTTIAFLLLPTAALAIERESYYSDLICETVYNGYTETLPSGIRPDCQTEFVAMEFDWATRQKSYECIGQSLVYAEESGLHPVCVLLARTDEELEFANSLDFEPFGIMIRVFDVRLYTP